MEYFYGTENRPLPAVEVVPSSDIPVPIHQVLVHESDMTSKLTNFFRGEIRIQALRKEYKDPYLLREVILVKVETQQPVEYGAIQIDLSNLPEEAKQLILEYHTPFGAILNRFKISYQSKPTVFFRVMADSNLVDLLQMKEQQWLYGRSNVLMRVNGEVLADVVEILPPIATLTC